MVVVAAAVANKKKNEHTKARTELSACVGFDNKMSRVEEITKVKLTGN